MNRTLFQAPWLSSINALTMIINSGQIVLGMIFILIVLCDRTCRSTPSFLAANTVLSITLYSTTILSITIHMWQCDVRSDQCMEDGKCFFRDYVNDVGATSAVYSLVVQSIDRLLAVVYANKIFFRTYKVRILLCLIQWIIASLFPIYFIYAYPQLTYDSASYICVVSHNSSSLLTVYTLTIGSLIPLIIIVSVYLRLFMFVRRLRRSTAHEGAVLLLANKRELRMIKRIVLLLAILILGAIPGIVFGSMKPPPVYEYRIYYLTVAIASFVCTLCTFFVTTQVKQWFLSRVHRLNGRVYPQGTTRNRY